MKMKFSCSPRRGTCSSFPKVPLYWILPIPSTPMWGDHCIGAKINEKNAPLRQKLNSGDQVEILTANNQSPKQDWLNFVVTGKARAKIRQALKEMQAKQGAFAKELLERKFKNRKIEYDEPTMMHVIKKLDSKS